MDTKLASDLLCSKAQLLHGSEHNYHRWECLPLKCEKCFLNKPSVLLCERSAFDDPSVTMKWEQWDTMDYSRRNLVGTGPLDPQQQQGIPLRFISPSLLFGQIIVQNSLNPDINWVGLYLMSTRQLWMWFICSSFVHNTAKDLHMVWAATVKMRSELRKNFEGTFLLPLVFSCGCKLTLQLFSLLVLVYLQFGNVFLD